MRRVLLSAISALALIVALPPSPAASETVMSRQDVTEGVASSSSGIVVPLILLLLVAFALGGNRGAGSVCPSPTAC